MDLGKKINEVGVRTTKNSENNIKEGDIVEGKIMNIVKFGAFVKIAPDKIGLMHISEVAPGYVKSVSDYFKENDTVKVKVISISPDDKIKLSAKRVFVESKKSNETKLSCSVTESCKKATTNALQSGESSLGSRVIVSCRHKLPYTSGKEGKFYPESQQTQSKNFLKTPTQPCVTVSDREFENMLKKFKEVSEDKFVELGISGHKETKRRNNWTQKH